MNCKKHITFIPTPFGRSVSGSYQGVVFPQVVKLRNFNKGPIMEGVVKNKEILVGCPEPAAMESLSRD